MMAICRMAMEWAATIPGMPSCEGERVDAAFRLAKAAVWIPPGDVDNGHATCRLTTSTAAA
jgi:hypothetical protein